MYLLFSLLYHFYSTIRIVVQLVHTNGTQPILTGQCTVVIERIPLSLELDNRAVVGITIRRFHINTFRLPRSQWRITDSISHPVVSFHAVIPIFIMIVGIRQIIFTIIIYYNRRICYRDFTSDSCNMNMIQLVTAYSIHY